MLSRRMFVEAWCDSLAWIDVPFASGILIMYEWWCDEAEGMISFDVLTFLYTL